MEDANGNNPVPLEGFRAMAKDSGSGAKSVKIKIKVPLKDRPDADKLKVVAMVRGEFKSKVINAENQMAKLLAIHLPLTEIQVLDQYKLAIFTLHAWQEMN